MHQMLFLNQNVRTSAEISLKFVPKGLINNTPSLVQIMAWRRPGDKPLFEPMIVRLLTHICVTRPQWVKPDGSCQSTWSAWLKWGVSTSCTGNENTCHSSLLNLFWEVNCSNSLLHVLDNVNVQKHFLLCLTYRPSVIKICRNVPLLYIKHVINKSVEKHPAYQHSLRMFSSYRL